MPPTTPTASTRPLLVLDMDECLLHATAIPLDIPEDFRYQILYVYVRPYLKEFLLAMSEKYQLAVWSTGTDSYVASLIASIQPKEDTFTFVWGRSKCRKVKDPMFGHTYYYKPLDKLKRYGYAPEQITMIDDSPEKIILSTSALITIDGFYGEKEDHALLTLLEELK